MSEAIPTPGTTSGAPEPPREPAGMKIVGAGVIASCITLSILFGWGVYLQFTQPCECTCPEVGQSAE